MAYTTSTLFAFISIFVSYVRADFCYREYNYLSYYYSYYTYCTFGCCGYYGNEYCCSYAGPIVGILFGMIAFIGIIVALIICRRRRLANSGVVVRTGGLTNTAFVSTATMQSGSVVQPAPVQYPVQAQYPTAQMGAYPQPPAYAPK